MEEKKNVNYSFKFLYAIGIILIVAGHCKNGGISLFYEWFTPYAFHLALFTFASGYFYKDDSDKDMKSYIWKKFKKLIIPMYVWNIIYAIFIQIIRLKDFSIGGGFTMYNILIAPLLNGHQFAFTMGLWYVVPLFVIEVLNVLFRKILKLKVKHINEYAVFIISLLLGMFGIYIAANGYNKDWYLFLDRILYLIPFYFLGILYNRQLEKYDKLNNIMYFSIIFIIQLVTITINGKTIKYTPSWCNNFTNNLISPYIIGATGIFFWLRISKILEPITCNSKVINYIANNTYSIMIHQFLGFFTVNTIFAVCSKFISTMNDFNWIKYKSDVWYLYIPKSLNQWYIIYLIAGISIPLLISYMLNKIKKLLEILIKNIKKIKG